MSPIRRLRSVTAHRGIAAGLAIAASMAPARAAADPAPCPPGALGVSRILRLDTAGGFAVGLKSYPKTLALDDHEVVLTFDDGPAAPTAKILDALAAECVKATFFVIGRNAQGLPKLVQREITEGHSVGHHTFSHPELGRIGEAAAKADIDKGFAAVDKAAYGSVDSAPRTPFFRYPGFADTPALNAWLEGRNIAIFGADLWASDWNPMTPRAELELILARLEKTKGGILLMHDIKKQTAAMLPDLLRALKQRGFRVVHIEPGGDDPVLLRDAPPGWTSETAKINAEIFAHEGARKRHRQRGEGRWRGAGSAR